MALIQLTQGQVAIVAEVFGEAERTNQMMGLL